MSIVAPDNTAAVEHSLERRTKPRVSCLMPACNAERYIAAAIDSILSQTLGDFELIVVNDGSTDGTASILDEYASKECRIRVFHEKHGGVVAALNKGLAHCTADYVARMDADDISAPHRFMVQTEYLDSHHDCACVGGLFTGIDEAGVAHGVFRFRRNRVTSFDTFPVRVALTLHPLAMFRRSALVAMGGYRSTFPHAEDYDLFLRTQKHGTIDNPEKLLFYYRTHSNSVSLCNAEVQEAEAAYAELAALLVHRGQPAVVGANMDFETARCAIDGMFPNWLIEPYIRFRVWRRLVNLDPERASSLKWQVLSSAVSLDPSTLLSRDYWGLRIRILGRLMLTASETIRDRLKNAIR
jgi:glycosyltransferase involved in cell wall biosynthesis